jgi:hypothetical protein
VWFGARSPAARTQSSSSAEGRGLNSVGQLELRAGGQREGAPRSNCLQRRRRRPGMRGACPRIVQRCGGSNWQGRWNPICKSPPQPAPIARERAARAGRGGAHAELWPTCAPGGWGGGGSGGKPTNSGMQPCSARRRPQGLQGAGSRAQIETAVRLRVAECPLGSAARAGAAATPSSRAAAACIDRHSRRRQGARARARAGRAPRRAPRACPASGLRRRRRRRGRRQLQRGARVPSHDAVVHRDGVLRAGGGGRGGRGRGRRGWDPTQEGGGAREAAQRPRARAAPRGRPSPALWWEPLGTPLTPVGMPQPSQILFHSAGGGAGLGWGELGWGGRTRLQKARLPDALPGGNVATGNEPERVAFQPHLGTSPTTSPARGEGGGATGHEQER